MLVEKIFLKWFPFYDNLFSILQFKAKNNFTTSISFLRHWIPRTYFLIYHKFRTHATEIESQKINITY